MSWHWDASPVFHRAAAFAARTRVAWVARTTSDAAYRGLHSFPMNQIPKSSREHLLARGKRTLLKRGCVTDHASFRLLAFISFLHLDERAPWNRELFADEMVAKCGLRPRPSCSARVAPRSTKIITLWVLMGPPDPQNVGPSPPLRTPSTACKHTQRHMQPFSGQGVA